MRDEPPPALATRRRLGLLLEGEVHPVPAAGLTVGRDPASAVVVASGRASWTHARVEERDGALIVTDLGSTNGTRVNGERIDRPTSAVPGDVITIGRVDLMVAPWHGRETESTLSLPAPGRSVSIGRDPGSALALDDVNVSGTHARLALDRDGRAILSDAGSANGTFVNGERVSRRALRSSDQVRIGGYNLTFDGAGLVAADERGALYVTADGVSRRAGRRTILEPTSIAIGPGEYVAIIGESGAGKTTLLKALAGVTKPDSGRVLINDQPLAVYRPSIGYVPQFDIVHGQLTVREALRYAAHLRLPEDTDRAGIDAAVRTAVHELGLEEQADTRVDRLSGGQRRRTGVAVELLSRPSLLFLDEPTTGLDPGFERRMMESLRALAAQSRTVVLVTHATQSLHLCDRVVVMGRGGRMLFDGAPDEVLAFFGVSAFDEVYTALDTTATDEWEARFQRLRRRRSAVRQLTHDRALAPSPPRQSARHQERVLRRRYVRVIGRDRRNLLILLGQVPLIGAALVALFAPDVFAAGGSPGDATQLLFLMVTTALWLGSIDAAREIVKERGVMARESAIGVGRWAYLRAKLSVLFAIVAVQTGLLVAGVLAVRPLHEDVTAYALVVAGILLTGCAAVSMGLAISAVVRSQDQATSLVPLVLIPQLFFAGAIIPVAKMSAAAKVLASLVFARWAFAEAGSAVDVNARFEARGPGHAPSVYGERFFAMAPLEGLGILILFAVAFVVLASLWLRPSSE
ncbi:MAG: FHA domain-containing protein [Baekduia sp.]